MSAAPTASPPEDATSREAEEPNLADMYRNYVADLERAITLGGLPHELPLGGDPNTHATYATVAALRGVGADRVRQPVNLAELMRGDMPPPEMVVPEWLVKGELHWIYAEAEGAKTWLALWLASRVMDDGGAVLWVDEELGPVIVAERLGALGVSPEVAGQQFIYLPFPGWNATHEDRDSWLSMIEAYRPQLVVFDTATDALANAEMDENSGIDVTTWVKSYCEPPRSAGAAVAVLDHTTKASGGSPGKHAVDRGPSGPRPRSAMRWRLRSHSIVNASASFESSAPRTPSAR